MEGMETLDKVDIVLGYMQIRWSTENEVHHIHVTPPDSKTDKRINMVQWFGVEASTVLREQ